MTKPNDVKEFYGRSHSLFGKYYKIVLRLSQVHGLVDAMIVSQMVVRCIDDVEMVVRCIGDVETVVRCIDDVEMVVRCIDDVEMVVRCIDDVENGLTMEVILSYRPFVASELPMTQVEVLGLLPAENDRILFTYKYSATSGCCCSFSCQ